MYGTIKEKIIYLGYCNKENVHFVKEREEVWVFTELGKQG